MPDAVHAEQNQGPNALRNRNLKEWYRTPEIRQLPFMCRLWARYCRQADFQRSGVARGGTLLFQLTNQIRRILAPESNLQSQLVHFSSRNLKLSLDPTDLEIFIHTIPTFSFGSSEFDLCQLVLKPGDTFIDIGANYGIFTIGASHLVGENGRVISIEANPKLVRHLEESITANSFSKTTVIQAAAGDEAKQVDFFISSQSSGRSSLYQSNADKAGAGQRTTVEMKTLEQIVRENDVSSIKLLKVDAEGAETAILKGAQQVLESLKPLIWFECDESRRMQSDSDELSPIEFLRSLGYDEFFDLHGLADGRRAEPNLQKLSNVLAVHSDGPNQLD